VYNSAKGEFEYTSLISSLAVGLRTHSGRLSVATLPPPRASSQVRPETGPGTLFEQKER